MGDLERLRAHLFEQRPRSTAQPSLGVGTWVKVGVRGERFWCRVKSMQGDGSLLGVLDNDLLKSSWRRGDELVLQRSHVLETAEPADGNTFRNLVAMFGSVAEAAVVWRNLRMIECVAVKPKPGTMFVLPPDI